MSRNRDYILVLGSQRSGTTWLASMLGAHPDISMLFETQGDEIKRLIGTRYSGNKLLLHRNIRFTQKASKFGYLINRMRSIGYKDQRRIFPTSKLSIIDYINMKAKIIIIERKEEDVINSMMRRIGYTRHEAAIEVDKCDRILWKLAGATSRDKAAITDVSYEDLVKATIPAMQRLCRFLDLPFYEYIVENGKQYNWIYDWQGSSSDTKHYKL